MLDLLAETQFEVREARWALKVAEDRKINIVQRKPDSNDRNDGSPLLDSIRVDFHGQAQQGHPGDLPETKETSESFYPAEAPTAQNLPHNQRNGYRKQAHRFAAQQILLGAVLLLIRHKSIVDADERR